MEPSAKRVSIVTLKMIRESSVLYGKRRIAKPPDALELLQPFLAEEDRERFMVLCLDSKNQPTTLHSVSVGNLNSAPVHPREVFKTAILGNANAIILSHNHPSGDPTPSQEDLEVTRRLQEAGKILGIEVLDHIILGGGTECYVSLKEQGLF